MYKWNTWATHTLNTVNPFAFSLHFFQPFVTLCREMAAGIYASASDQKRTSGSKVKFFIKIVFQKIPGFFFFQVAENLIVLNAPRFITAAPAGDLDFETVVLNVHAGRENDSAVRNVCFVSFAASDDRIIVGTFAAFFPCFAKRRIDPGFHFVNVAVFLQFLLCFPEFPDNFFPVFPWRR